MSEFAVPETMHIANTGPEPVAADATDAPPPRTPRDEAMAAIYEKRTEQVIAELDQSASDEAERAAAAEDRETERARGELARRAQGSGAAPQRVQQPSQTRTVMIDGAQFQVTEAQYDQLAADGMLARQTVAQYQRQAAGQQQAPQRMAEPAPAIDAGEAAEVARRIQFGDEREASAAVQHLAQRIAARQPQIDPRAIVGAAVQELQQQQTLQHNLQTIGQEFPEVFNDRTLAQLAALKLGELRQRDAALGQSRPDLDSYREACRMVQGALGSRGSLSQPASRLDRKRGTPSIPSASDRRGVSQQPERYPSGAEIVDRMRKQRGQF